MAINWTMGVTIMGSFGAALSAQMAANFFTNRREDKKYDRECFQNLYSPLLLRITKYVSCENYKAHDEEAIAGSFSLEELETETLFKEIMEYMGRNLKYAHPEIIIEYEFLKDDSIISISSRLNFCRIFLADYIRLSNKLNVLSKDVENRIKPPLFFIDLLSLLKECGFLSLANESRKALYSIEKVILIKDNDALLNRITAIQQEIKYVKEESVNQDRYDEAFTDACHFICEFIDKFGDVDSYAEKIAKRWRYLLEKDLGYNPFLE